MARRVLLHDFSGSGPFAPNPADDVYGGTDTAVRVIRNTESRELIGAISDGALVLQGVSVLNADQDTFVRYEDAYSWGAEGYHPNDTPPHGSRVCGLEASFKFVPVNGALRTQVQFALGPESGPFSSGTFSRIDLEFIKTPGDDPQYTVGPVNPPQSGMFLGQTSGTGVDADLNPGTVAGTIPVDFDQWQTLKMLPTGDWSWGYRGGAVIRSGTLPQVRDAGGFLSIGAFHFNYTVGRHSLSDGGSVVVVTGGTADVYVDDVALWIEGTTFAPPLRLHPRSDGLGLSSAVRAWPPPRSQQYGGRPAPGSYL